MHYWLRNTNNNDDVMSEWEGDCGRGLVLVKENSVRVNPRLPKGVSALTPLGFSTITFERPEILKTLLGIPRAIQMRHFGI